MKPDDLYLQLGRRVSGRRLHRSGCGHSVGVCTLLQHSSEHTLRLAVTGLTAGSGRGSAVLLLLRSSGWCAIAGCSCTTSSGGCGELRSESLCGVQKVSDLDLCEMTRSPSRCGLPLCVGLRRVGKGCRES